MCTCRFNGVDVDQPHDDVRAACLLLRATVRALSDRGLATRTEILQAAWDELAQAGPISDGIGAIHIEIGGPDPTSAEAGKEARP